MRQVALALSGGIDSMALAIMLKEKKVSFVAITVDHGMREESAAEAKAIAAQMKKLSIPHTVLKIKTKPPTSNKMEWARKERYRSLLDYCKTQNIKKLYVAHHLDDQIETFFLNLERGSGLKGLSGMRPVSQMEGIEIIRPLLNMPKSELVAYLKKHKIKHHEDPTNTNLDYKRNRLRALLSQAFPETKELPQRIGQAMEHLAEVEEFIALQAEKASDAVVNKNTIHTALFLSLHPLIQYRVLLKLLMQISARPKPPRSENIRNVLNRIHNQEKAFTLHGIQGKSTKDKWVLRLEEKAVKPFKN
jgi:tRNA(Ile)-lysidine synthase